MSKLQTILSEIATLSEQEPTPKAKLAAQIMSLVAELQDENEVTDQELLCLSPALRSIALMGLGTILMSGLKD